MSDRQHTLDFEAVDFTRSRPSDPATIQNAEAKVAPKLSAVRAQMYAVADSVPRTARELAELAFAAQPAGGRTEVETFRKRASKLHDDGLYKSHDPRCCKHTGFKATTYTRAN